MLPFQSSRTEIAVVSLLAALTCACAQQELVCQGSALRSCSALHSCLSG